MLTAVETDSPRLAELLGGLSLATDLVAGLALETAMKTAIVAQRVARVLQLPAAQQRASYYAGVLRFIGCSAFAPEFARIAGGDDQALLGALATVDTSRPTRVIARAAQSQGVAAALRLAADPSGPRKLASAHCELAGQLAQRLGMETEVVVALGETYERFDGTGQPLRRRGAQLSSVGRTLAVAFRAEVHRAIEGPAAALKVIAARSGNELDPDVAQALLQLGVQAFDGLELPSVWELFLASEPAPVMRLPRAGVRDVAAAFAAAVDSKSMFTLGHSTGVAALVEAAADGARLSSDDTQNAVCAALLHDLGRMAIPNGIWDKPGALGVVERQRMESHAEHTERILSLSPLTRDLAQLSASAHERSDGRGYPHRIAQPSAAARLIAAADAFHAMTEERPHRRAFTPERAAQTLVAEAKAGRFDRGCAEAVLAAAGQKKIARIRGGWPAQLSDREVEVLAALARGRTNKQIAKALFISGKTVQHHIAHIYEKTGVSTRAAAAVFAQGHGLIDK
jgi:HD-GYP domain-containing protein (c-di-GMP phosphodiesterase class II)